MCTSGVANGKVTEQRAICRGDDCFNKTIEKQKSKLE